MQSLVRTQQPPTLQTDSKRKNELVRYSKFMVSPVLQLTGHEGPLFTCQFSPSGQQVASAGFDKRILLWNCVDGSNSAGFTNVHKNAILDLKWSRDGRRLMTSSADLTVAVYDLESEMVERRFRQQHKSIICSLAYRGPLGSASEMLASCSDDGLVCLYDLRSCKVGDVKLQHKYPVVAVEFDRLNEHLLYTGGVDNDVLVWDMRNSDEPVSRLLGHSDTITGLAVSPDGTKLLSASVDNICKVWDIKPFSALQDRLVANLHGSFINGPNQNIIRPSWNYDGSLAACGSADSSVLIWDIELAELKLQLPVHKSCVNQVSFHPSQNLIATCSEDSTLFLGDLSYYDSQTSM